MMKPNDWKCLENDDHDDSTSWEMSLSSSKPLSLRKMWSQALRTHDMNDCDADEKMYVEMNECEIWVNCGWNS